MDHTQAIREKMTEKYLLDELTPQLREDFEEHFFDCLECARDVKAGVAFVEHSRTVLSTADPIPVAVDRTAPKKSWRMGWAFAAPAFAVLLLVVGYQNFVQYPRLNESVAALNTPQILPSVSLTSSRDATVPDIHVRRSEPFLLFLDVPADAHFASYSAELYGPDGSRQWELFIPAEAAKDTLSIRVPAGAGGTGAHTVVLYGFNPGAKRGTALRRYRFQLDYQN
jgi:hypothetical protein